MVITSAIIHTEWRSGKVLDKYFCSSWEIYLNKYLRPKSNEMKE